MSGNVFTALNVGRKLKVKEQISPQSTCVELCRVPIHRLQVARRSRHKSPSRSRNSAAADLQETTHDGGPDFLKSTLERDPLWPQRNSELFIIFIHTNLKGFSRNCENEEQQRSVGPTGCQLKFLLPSRMFSHMYVPRDSEVYLLV